jgi:hypothetical protein
MRTSDIQPIEAPYNGYRSRSRLEARLAADRGGPGRCN